MKKKFIRSTFVAAIAMANVEALAELESDKLGSGTTGSCTEVGYKHDGCVLEYTMVKLLVV